MVGGESPGDEAEAQPPERRHHVGLLEDQPADDLRSLERIVWQQRCPIREENENRIRFGQVRRLVDLQHRRAALRVDRRVLAGERLAGEDVDRHSLVFQTELREHDSRLEAVGRRDVVVETEHAE